MKLLSRLYIWLVKDRWSLGFIEDPLIDIINGRPYSIKYVKGIPRNKWYADPFILDYNDTTIELLVEEWLYKNNKGRIARLVIDRQSFEVLKESIILDLPTHLSFPFIQRNEGKIFVYPESSASGEWDQYEYNRDLDKLLLVKRIIPQPLTDSVLTNCFEEDLVFSTVFPTSNKSVLSVFKTDGTIISTIRFNSNTARGAGDWFFLDGNIYRPAQDCNGGYGRAVIIQEVKNTGKYSFEFRDVCRLVSDNHKFYRGLHTFNHYKDLSVVDVNGYKREVLGPFTDWLNVLIKRFVLKVR